MRGDADISGNSTLRRASLVIVAIAFAIAGCAGAASPEDGGGGIGSSPGLGGTDDAGEESGEASGVRLDLGDGADGGTAGLEEGGDVGCDSVLLGSEAIPPNVLIVLDRSNSMRSQIGGVSKWDIARDAVEQLTTAHADDVRWGLMMYPGFDQLCSSNDECDAGTIFVDPADVPDEMVAFLGGSETCSAYGTPVAETLAAVVDYPALEDPSRGNYVLLLTDGEATCNNPVPVVEQLRQQVPEVKTFVVGFDATGDGFNPNQLAAMAEAGGTALPGDPVYYHVDDAASLDNAFEGIAGEVLSCVFELDEVPPNPDDLYVFFDMNEIPIDPAHVDGWDYDEATNTITFYGAACDAIQASEVEEVSVVFGCPELPPAG